MFLSLQKKLFSAITYYSDSLYAHKAYVVDHGPIQNRSRESGEQ